MLSGHSNSYIKHGENNKKHQSFVINLADFLLAYDKSKKIKLKILILKF
jgi:hypothetical protein